MVRETYKGPSQDSQSRGEKKISARAKFKGGTPRVLGRKGGKNVRSQTRRRKKTSKPEEKRRPWV